jgi:hypothetical protein
MDEDLVDFTVKWQRDGGQGNDDPGHLDVKNLILKVQPLELQVDTINLFRLLLWLRDVDAQIRPEKGADVSASSHVGSTMDLNGKEDTLMAQYFGLGRAEDLLRHTEGDEDDDIVGEPDVAKFSDVDNDGEPVFFRSLNIDVVKIRLSLLSTGRPRWADHDSDRFKMVDLVLRHVIPVNIIRSDIELGHPNRIKERLWCGNEVELADPVHTVKKSNLQDQFKLTMNFKLQNQFKPRGLSELINEVVADYTQTCKRHLSLVMFRSNWCLNVSTTCGDLRKALVRLKDSVVRCRPTMILEAVFLILETLIESVEGFFTALAKSLCHVAVGYLPRSLRQQPVGVRETLLDGFCNAPLWIISHYVTECSIILRHSWYSGSYILMLRSPFVCMGKGVIAVLAIVVTCCAKLLQCLNILVQRATVTIGGSPLRSIQKTKRPGSQQHLRGLPVQFSRHASGILRAVKKKAGFGSGRAGRAGKGDWRMCELPDKEGWLLAVRDNGRDNGFFHLVQYRDINEYPEFIVAWHLLLPADVRMDLMDADFSSTPSGQSGLPPPIEIRYMDEESWIQFMKEESINEQVCKVPLQLKSKKASSLALGFFREFLSE